MNNSPSRPPNGFLKTTVKLPQGITLSFMSQPKPVISKFTMSLYRKAHALVFVYDLNSLASLETLETWVKQIDSVDSLVPRPKLRLLVGTKSDLPTQIPDDAIAAYSKTYRAHFDFKVSALTTQGISELFNKLVADLSDPVEPHIPPPSSSVNCRCIMM